MQVTAGNVNIHLMRLDTNVMSTRTTGTIPGFSVAALFLRAFSSLVAGMTFAMVLGSPFPAFAQFPPPITTSLRYTFSVPVAKPVVNPCSTRFVLITGNTNLTIDTSTGPEFKIFVSYLSSGSGRDALADGTLISDGTQKANYAYSGEVTIEAGSPATPATFITSIPIVDYVERSSGDTTDAFLMSSLFETTFTNGVPGVPVLKGIDVSCVH
jgi:hypothetical protein